MHGDRQDGAGGKTVDEQAHPSTDTEADDAQVYQTLTDPITQIEESFHESMFVAFSCSIHVLVLTELRNRSFRSVSRRGLHTHLESPSTHLGISAKDKGKAREKEVIIEPESYMTDHNLDNVYDDMDTGDIMSQAPSPHTQTIGLDSAAQPPAEEEGPVPLSAKPFYHVHVHSESNVKKIHNGMSSNPAGARKKPVKRKETVSDSDPFDTDYEEKKKKGKRKAKLPPKMAQGKFGGNRLVSNDKKARKDSSESAAEEKAEQSEPAEPTENGREEEVDAPLAEVPAEPPSKPWKAAKRRKRRPPPPQELPQEEAPEPVGDVELNADAVDKIYPTLPLGPDNPPDSGNNNSMEPDVEKLYPRLPEQTQDEEVVQVDDVPLSPEAEAVEAEDVPPSPSAAQSMEGNDAADAEDVDMGEPDAASDEQRDGSQAEHEDVSTNSDSTPSPPSKKNKMKRRQSLVSDSASDIAEAPQDRGQSSKVTLEDMEPPASALPILYSNPKEQISNRPKTPKVDLRTKVLTREGQRRPSMVSSTESAFSQALTSRTTSMASKAGKKFPDSASNPRSGASSASISSTGSDLTDLIFSYKNSFSPDELRDVYERLGRNKENTEQLLNQWLKKKEELIAQYMGGDSVRGSSGEREASAVAAPSPAGVSEPAARKRASLASTSELQFRTPSPNKRKRKRSSYGLARREDDEGMEEEEDEDEYVPPSTSRAAQVLLHGTGSYTNSRRRRASKPLAHSMLEDIKPMIPRTFTPRVSEPSPHISPTATQATTRGNEEEHMSLLRQASVDTRAQILDTFLLLSEDEVVARILAVKAQPPQ